MNLSLKQKLLAGFAVNCLLTIASSLFIMFQVQHMRSLEKEINEVRVPSSMAALRMARYVVDASFAFRNYLLYYKDPALATKYEAARQAGWKNALDQVEILKQLSPVEDQPLLAKLDDEIHHRNMQIQIDSLADMSDGTEAGLQKALDRMKAGSALVAATQADTVEVTHRVDVRKAQDHEAMSAAQTRTWILALVAGLLTAFTGVFIGLYLGKQILSGIFKVSDRIGEVAEGDLSGEPLIHEANDEIGAMVANINNMQGNLRQMIQSVCGNSSKVANAAVILAASTDQLLQNANLQKSQSDQIVAAMHEMGAAIAEVSANAARAAKGAVDAGQVAQEGGHIVGQTVSAMQSLTETSRTTSEQVEGLARSSDQIGKVLSVIGEIAEQTNLLALNAAIEAARAGDQGRGFAVVAGEVRRLAERTGQATREIDGMIGNIQSEAKKAVDSIKAEIVHVNESAESASRAGSSINGIIQASELVKDMIGQIATASHEQSAATDEVNRTMNQIAQVIDQSTTGTQDSAKACAELSLLASHLQDAVSQFQLDRGGSRSNSDRTPPRY
jgi:methyl-accepting chemotaxis protein